MAEKEPANQLRYEATASFIRLLEKTRSTLAISIYMSHRLVLVSAVDGQLFFNSGIFQRPMGIATNNADGVTRFAIATWGEVLLFADEPLLARGLPEESGRYDHLLVPRVTVFSGDIDAHDLAWVGKTLYAANTRFSCIAEIDGRQSFTPVWTPSFITRLMPEDRCHLNGIAAASDRVAYVTAFDTTDEPRGWNPRRLYNGVLLAVPGGETVLSGLCMPHSPRLFGDRLYVLDSGNGAVLAVDPVQRTSKVLAELPGFTRGLDIEDDVLFVGLSGFRGGDRAPLPIEQKLQRPLICGVAAVDCNDGRVLGWLRFLGDYDEVFDIKVLPNFQRGAILGVLDERHRRALVLPGRAFWGEPISPTDTANSAQNPAGETS